MLNISRVVLRDAATRALLLAVDGAQTPLRLEGTGTSFRVEESQTGRNVVHSPVAILELIETEAIHYLGAVWIRESKELRHVRTVIELG